MDELVAATDGGEIEFSLAWSEPGLSASQARNLPAGDLTRGCLSVRLGGSPVWCGETDSLGFEWTWIELLEFLGENWLYLSVEDGAPLVKFLAALGPENDLFQRAFAELGASEAEYSAASATPTTQAFGDFIMRTALQGSFIDVLTILYVTEGTYLDWATRLLEAGRRPDAPKIYSEWIDIHGPDVLGELVDWLAGFIDNAGIDTTSNHNTGIGNTGIGSSRSEIERIFRTTLRYEYRFWQAAYHGEEWD